MAAQQLVRQRRQSIILALSPAIFDSYVLTIDVAGFAQTFAERRKEIRKLSLRCAFETSNHRQRRLLRTYCDRPNRRATDQPDELAPSHSITSSARASRLLESERPRALAVLRLTTSLYWVGAWTGSSAGLAPLSIRSTYSAARA